MKTLKERIVIILNELQEKYKIKNKFLAEILCRKYYPDLHKEIKQYQIDHNLVVSKFPELIYIITTGYRTCKMCTTVVKFQNYDKGYINYCSSKCQHSDPDLKLRIVEATKKAVLEKYGVENISQLDSIKKKKEETMLANYGVKYNSLRKDIQQQNSERMSSPEHILKIKEGLIKNRGVSNPSLDREVIERRQITFDDKRDKRLSQMAKSLKYKFIKYNNEFDIVFKCPKNHIFNINYQFFKLRFDRQEELCLECNKIHSGGPSKQELELRAFIEENYKGSIINNIIILGKKHIDIYFPEIKIGIEYNGTYYHNESTGTPDNYHYNKTVLAKEKGIKLIHIYEDDWIYKRNIIKSRILNQLKLTPLKIYARKCQIKIIDSKLTKIFLNENHIQGNTISKTNLGLYYNNELVSIMTFGERKISGKSSLELLRFCNKINTNIIGAASKLFNYYKNTYQFEKIISYADRSWSIGELYEILGFEFKGETIPNYYYVINGIRQNRLNFSKSKLINKGMLMNNETERECMLRLKYYRIYDSGSLIYEYKSTIK